MAQSDSEKAAAQLRELLPAGSTVQTILRHVSRSGMTRAISPVVNGEDVTWMVCRAFPAHFKRDNRHDGVRMQGAGMDMGFELVYVLSSLLYPEGFECIGDGGPDTWPRLCPSNDHSNGDRDYAPHHHSSGGYALRHRWL